MNPYIYSKRVFKIRVAIVLVLVAGYSYLETLDEPVHKSIDVGIDVQDYIKRSEEAARFCNSQDRAGYTLTETEIICNALKQEYKNNE